MAYDVEISDTACEAKGVSSACVDPISSTNGHIAARVQLWMDWICSRCFFFLFSSFLLFFVIPGVSFGLTFYGRANHISLSRCPPPPRPGTASYLRLLFVLIGIQLWLPGPVGLDEDALSIVAHQLRCLRVLVISNIIFVDIELAFHAVLTCNICIVHTFITCRQVGSRLTPRVVSVDHCTSPVEITIRDCRLSDIPRLGKPLTKG